jgi:hypothetical protein
VWGLAGLWDRIEKGEIHVGAEQAGSSGTDVGGISVPHVRSYGTLAGSNGASDTETALPAMRAVDVSRFHGGGQEGNRHADQSPVIVLEDPPNLITCRVRGLPGTLQIADLRNWGIDQYPNDLLPGLRAKWLLDVMIRMIDVLVVNGWGGLKLTSGAQAMGTFRYRFLTDTIHCHTDQPSLEIERDALYGGRCECFRLGRVPGRCYHLDFRSLYAAVMYEDDLPAQLVGRGTGAPSPELLRRDEIDGVIAKVTLHTDTPRYPCRKDGIVIYPVGVFTTTLAGPELAVAQIEGEIDEYHEWVGYRRSPCCRDYALSLYSALRIARDGEDGPMVAWLKRLLVSLPGRFAMHGSKWVDAPDALPPAPWCQWTREVEGGELVRHRAMAWQCQREVKEPWAVDAMPAIAAWITSAARVRLLDAIEAAGWEQVYYCDTDSVIVSETGFDALLNGGWVATSELGFLREMEDGEDLEVCGIKHYTIAGHRRCSGEPKGMKERGPDAVHYWYREWLRQAVRGGHAPIVERVLRRYARDEVYRHGTVGPDGKVSPFRLTERQT